MLKKVENRDREIERLNRLLDGGRSCDIVTLEGSLRNNEKVIAHQNIQVRKILFASILDEIIDLS